MAKTSIITKHTAGKWTFRTKKAIAKASRAKAKKALRAYA